MADRSFAGMAANAFRAAGESSSFTLERLR
jgi:hypothetical protein